MADIVVPDDSWISLEDADTYFAFRLRSDAWKVAPKDVKQAALVTAKRQLGMLYSGLPTDVSEVMEHSNCEQALFLLQQNGDNDMRAGLQAQGVTQAGVIKETYAGAGGVAIAPLARQILIAFYTPATGGVFGAEITRDEDE